MSVGLGWIGLSEEFWYVSFVRCSGLNVAEYSHCQFPPSSENFLSLSSARLRHSLQDQCAVEQDMLGSGLTSLGCCVIFSDQSRLVACEHASQADLGKLYQGLHLIVYIQLVRS